MKTNNLIAQKFAEFDEEFPDGGDGFGADYDAMKLWIKSFAKEILKSVGEEVNNLEKEYSKNPYMHPDNLVALYDLRVRLKEMEEVI